MARKCVKSTWDVRRETLEPTLEVFRGNHVYICSKIYIRKAGPSFLGDLAEGTVFFKNVPKVGLVCTVNIFDTDVGAAKAGDGLSANLSDPWAGEGDSKGNAW